MSVWYLYSIFIWWKWLTLIRELRERIVLHVLDQIFSLPSHGSKAITILGDSKFYFHFYCFSLWHSISFPLLVRFRYQSDKYRWISLTWKFLWWRQLKQSIYIKMNVCLFVCLFVRYTFPHRTTDSDETFQEWSLHPGEGRRLLFLKKERILQVLQAPHETDQ